MEGTEVAVEPNFTGKVSVPQGGAGAVHGSRALEATGVPGAALYESQGYVQDEGASEEQRFGSQEAQLDRQLPNEPQNEHVRSQLGKEAPD